MLQYFFLTLHSLLIVSMKYQFFCLPQIPLQKEMWPPAVSNILVKTVMSGNQAQEAENIARTGLDKVLLISKCL